MKELLSLLWERAQYGGASDDALNGHPRVRMRSHASSTSTTESARLREEKEADLRLKERREAQQSNEDAIQREVLQKRREREEEVERLEREEEEEARKRREQRRRLLREAEEADRIAAEEAKEREREETRSVEKEVIQTKVRVESERQRSTRSSTKSVSDALGQDDVFGLGGSAPPTPKGASGAQFLFGRKRHERCPHRPNSISGTAGNSAQNEDNNFLIDSVLTDHLMDLRSHGDASSPKAPGDLKKGKDTGRNEEISDNDNQHKDKTTPSALKPPPSHDRLTSIQTVQHGRGPK